MRSRIVNFTNDIQQEVKGEQHERMALRSIQFSKEACLQSSSLRFTGFFGSAILLFLVQAPSKYLRQQCFETEGHS